MRAYAIDSFGQTGTVRDLPVPEPAANEIQIRVGSSGVATTDIAVMYGVLAPYMEHVFPLIPGFDAAGVVTALGADVEGFKLGDHVFGYRRHPPMGRGTMADYVTLPAEATQHTPQNREPWEMAIFPHCGLTAAAAVEAAQIGEGSTVVLLGASGGVGSFATQLAAQQGGHVVAITLSRNEDYVRGLGAVEVVDHDTTDPVEVVRNAHPEGVDALIDLAGVAELTLGMSGNVRTGGRVVSVIAAPDVDGLATRGVQSMMATRFTHEHRLADLTQRLASGSLQFPNIQKFPFAQVSEAIALQATRHVRGKLVLMMD